MWHSALIAFLFNLLCFFLFYFFFILFNYLCVFLLCFFPIGQNLFYLHLSRNLRIILFFFGSHIDAAGYSHTSLQDIRKTCACDCSHNLRRILNLSSRPWRLRSFIRKTLQIRFDNLCHRFRQIRQIYTSGNMHILSDLLGYSRIRRRTLFRLFKHRFLFDRRCLARIPLIILFLLQRSQRLIFHLKLHSLIDIFALAEPEYQIITLFQTLCCHPCFMIQLGQLKGPFFYILCPLKFFQRFNLLRQRCILCF